MDKFLALFIALLCSLLFSMSVGDELVLRDPNQAPNKLLVLKNGRVIDGRMTPRDNGYDILQPGGRLFVGSEQIRFRADNMDDAWQKMRDSMGELTPDTHLELAKWCYTNKLQGKAKKELLDALHLDPYRGDAKRMLQSIIRNEQRDSLVQNTSAAEIAARLKKVREQGSMAMERRSLGGLPGSLAKVFTTRIQPIVSNKCGNSRCHGPGRNEFVVMSISRGSTPVKSEQNLASILNQIDYEDPARSPLLAATVGAHGGSSAPLFPGRSGRSHVETLRAWVMAAADELDGVSAVKRKSEVKQVSLHEASNSADGPGLTHKETQAKSFVRDAVMATKHDDFDPDDFNRKHHGRSRFDVPNTKSESVAKPIGGTYQPN